LRDCFEDRVPGFIQKVVFQMIPTQTLINRLLLQAERARGLCEALELVLDRVHAVRVDTANNKLRAIAPVIRDHGVEYERSHFKKKLDAGKITLEHTERWMQHTVDYVINSNDSRVSREKLISGADKDFESVLFIAMTDLIADYPHWGGEQRGKDKEDQLPETMLLDLLRIKALNAHFHTDIVSTIILITVDQEIKCRMRDGIVRSQLLKSVSNAVLRTPPKPNNAKFTIKAVWDELINHLAEAEANTIQNLIEKHIKRTHPVYTHMVRCSLLTSNPFRLLVLRTHIFFMLCSA
jgi:hypothetical protein